MLVIKEKNNSKKRIVSSFWKIRAYLATIFEISFLFPKTKNKKNIFGNEKLFYVIMNRKQGILVVFTYFLKTVLKNNYTNM